MDIVKYNLDHLFDLKVNYNKYPICNGNIVLLHNILNNGISKTFIVGGVPIAIISVMLYHKGVAGIYIIPSKEAHAEHKNKFIKGVFSIREELENIVREYKLRRVETLCIDDKEHSRWMEYLGFLPEGKKESYGLNGEDYIMWSRLWV